MTNPSSNRLSDPSNPPLHSLPASLGAGLLVAVLATDGLYTSTFNTQWETFSIWLLTAGLILAALAGVILLFELFLHRVGRINWLRFCALTAAAVLSLLNAFVHSRDAYSAVAPTGIIISFCVAVILVTIGINGWAVARQPESQS